MDFCQVKLDNLNLTQAKEKIGYFLANPGQYKIFTPNPEFVVQAQKDCGFREVLNSSDLNICDGFGLQLFSDCPRIPGVDFMLEICKIAVEKNIGVYLLGSGSDEIVKKTAENLQNQIFNLKIVGYDKGLKIDSTHLRPPSLKLRGTMDGQVFNPPSSRLVGLRTGKYSILSYDKSENEKIIENINNSKASILFVAFGMGKQEKWIHENLSKLLNIKIAMGVGGAFDYLSNVVRRAPCFLRKIGLEWLYRLFKQPRRLKRIFNATIVFTFIVFKNKILK